jgi:F-type H+-transporting ATPase subunit a
VSKNNEMLNKINTLRIIFSLFLTNLFLLGANTAFANDSLATPMATEHAAEAHDANHEVHAAHGEDKFNAGKMILEHVGDAHDWHIAGHLALPLPVIIYSEAGLDIFSSSRFEHGHATYHSDKTNITYKIHENKISAVNADGSENEALTATFYDLSITKNVASLLFSLILLCWIFISVANTYTKNPGKAPKGLQSFVEPIIVFLRDDVAKSSIGEKHYKKFMPYLLTVFFFIWINNLLGLIPIIPGGANLTGNVAVTMTLAVFTFVLTTINGNSHYWRHVFAMPGVPVGVLVLLTPIEILGIFLKPFVLMVRLFANITAGHIIALSFFSLIFIFGEMNTGAGLGFSLFSTAFTVFMMVMELLVAFLQAYVFTLLSAVYFGSAVEEGHHEEAHGH